MICAACKRPMGPGARKCMYCGAAAVEPALADAPAAPPRAVPLPRPRRSLPLRSGGAAKAATGGLLSVIVIVGLIGMKVCRAVNRISGENVASATYTLQPGEDRGGTLDVKGSYRYTFEVTALDAPTGMFVGRVSSNGNLSQADLQSLIQKLVLV